MKPININVHVPVIDYLPLQEVARRSNSRPAVFTQRGRDWHHPHRHRQSHTLLHLYELIDIIRLALAVHVLPDCSTTMAQLDNKRSYSVTTNVDNDY